MIIENFHPAADNGFSCFSRLPDKIVLEVVNKLTDLKTLCICKLVSRRFYQIVLEADAVSFNVPLMNLPPKLDSYTSTMLAQESVHLVMNSSTCAIAESSECKSFTCAITSMKKFRLVKFLCIQLPSSPHEVGVDHNSLLFKWKVVKFSNKVDSVVFLSPNSICDTKGLIINGQKDELSELSYKKFQTCMDCWYDSVAMSKILLSCILEFPMLEKVSIIDSGKRGKVSVGGAKIGIMRKWLHSPSESNKQRVTHSSERPEIVSRRYIPLMKLPVSGYLMKGVTLYLIKRDGYHLLPDEYDHGFVKSNDMDDDFEQDKEEAAAYDEAMMEIFKNWGSMQTM